MMSKKILFIMACFLLSAYKGMAFEDNIQRLGTFYPYFFAELLDVKTEGEYIYVSGVGGFIILDVSDPANPVQTGRIDPGSIYKRFYTSSVHNDLAISCARLDGIYFIDISDKSAPELLSIFKESSTSFEAALAVDHYVLAAAHNDGLYTIDISDRNNPVFISRNRSFDNVWDIKRLDKNRAVIADASAGIKVIDISDPTKPDLISSVRTTGNAREVQIRGDFAYAAVGSFGMDIIDISDPQNPQFIKNYPSTGVTNHLDVSGDYAFLANWKHIEVIDISDKQNPGRLATEKTPVRAMACAVKDSATIYVADWSQVHVYKFQNIKNPDIELGSSSFTINHETANQTLKIPVTNLGRELLQITDVQITSNNMNTAQNFQIGPYKNTLTPDERIEIPVKYLGDFSTIAFANFKIQSNDPDESVVNARIISNDKTFGVGKEAIDFSLNDLYGQPHRLSDYRGSVVVLVFFASW